MRIATVLLLLLAAAPAAAQPQPPTKQPPTKQPPAQPQERAPRYLEAMSVELTAMGVGASCTANTAVQAHCQYNARGVRSGRTYEVHLVYNDDSDTIYAFIDHYLVSPAEASQTPALLRRLMELNWEMLASKFEWDASDGEVRLSLTLHTDSNFDRRAFRSLLRGLVLAADEYTAELTRLAPPAAAPAPSPAPRPTPAPTMEE